MSNNLRPTKRKAFNFLRSYFDVLNELDNDKDKLNFLLSIINKQFLDEDPKGLNFIVNLCYESQRHSVESSVKGWKRVNGCDPVTNPTIDPTTNPKEVEGKGKGEVKEEGQVKEEGAAQIVKNLEWFVNQIDEIYLENLEYTHKGKDIQQAVKEAYAHVASDSLRLKNLDGAGAKKLLNTWLANMKIQANGNGINKKTADDNATADYLRKHYSAKLKQQ